MPYYLMRFDRSTLEEPTFEEFFDRAEASARHRVAEREAPADVDVVLFGARSLDALRVTHSSYFKGRERREWQAAGDGSYGRNQLAGALQGSGVAETIEG